MRGEQNPSQTHESVDTAEIRSVMRFAGLPDDAPAELIGPLIESYVARIRHHRRADLLGEEPALTFDPSWNDEAPGDQ